MVWPSNLCLRGMHQFAGFKICIYNHKSIHLFWNLEDPVLVQILSYNRTKITYHLLLIDFFHKLISMQDVAHNMLHSHLAQQMPPLYMHQWVISPTNDNDAELNRKSPFGIDLSEVLPDLLRMKAEKPGIQFSQHT